MKIGFVVNPIAGAGGKIGMKGTDNIEEVIERGGEPLSPFKAKEFCNGLKKEFITCSSNMGEDYIGGEIVYKTPEKTTAEDTKKACIEFLKRGAEMIVFVGGDGTARDVYTVVGKKLPVLGIPAGVKMYSGVFALNATAGRKILNSFLEGNAEIVEREIMDVDENAYRKNVFRIRLFGIAISPSIKNFLQYSKKVFPDENEAKKEIAEFMALICKKGTYIVGPGITTKAIFEKIGIEKTLLGVDVIENGRIIARDAGEKEIINAIDGKNARIIVSPLGKQGFIFGRGNQQISSRVIKKVGTENIIIVSTPQKMMYTPQLFVDTGDKEIDRKISGWKKVITGFGIAIRKKIIY